MGIIKNYVAGIVQEALSSPLGGIPAAPGANVVFPGDCDTPRRRTEYLYRAQELLRNLHNLFVEWKQSGLTQLQYDLLPAKIKAVFPYKAKITEAEHLKFITEEFEPRQQNLSRSILNQRLNLKQSIQWTIDVGELPK